MFPVEDFRTQIIKQYFLKSSEDPEFTIDHPLRKLNARYLTCLRQMSKLIENKEIEPLRLPPIEKILTISEPDRLFLRFIEDYQYSTRMKGAK